MSRVRVGERLRRIRQARERSIVSLSNSTKLSVPFLNDVERGQQPVSVHVCLQYFKHTKPSSADRKKILGELMYERLLQGSMIHSEEATAEIGAVVEKWLR